MPEKFTRQIAFVNVSLKRLFDVIRRECVFPGVGVDLQGTVANGQFAIIGPVALSFAPKPAAQPASIPQSGSTKPLIRPLEGKLQSGHCRLGGNW